jgi:hypothetical protein
VSLETTSISDIKPDSWVNIKAKIIKAEQASGTSQSGVDWLRWTLILKDQSNETIELIDFGDRTYSVGEVYMWGVLRAQIYNNKLQLKTTSKSQVKKLGEMDITVEDKIDVVDADQGEFNRNFMEMTPDELSLWLNTNPTANPAQYGHVENILMHKQYMWQTERLIKHIAWMLIGTAEEIEK